MDTAAITTSVGETLLDTAANTSTERPLSPTQRFRNWLNEFVSTSRSGDRIPTEHEIARMFSISRNTVHHEISRLARMGLVTRVTKRGTCIGESNCPAPPPPVLQPRMRSWEMVAAWVREQIGCGKIRIGYALPPLKMLSARFSVSSATVSAAYRHLEKVGFARKIGKRYLVSRIGSDELLPTSRQVVFVQWDDDTYNPYTNPDQFPRAWDQMESELLRCGFRLRHEPRQRFREICSIVRRNNVLPEAFVITSVWSENECREILSTLRECARSRHRQVPRILFLTNAMIATTKSVCRVHCGAIGTAVARTCAEYCFQNQIPNIAVFLKKRHGFLGDYTKIWIELRNLNPDSQFAFVVEKGGTAAREIHGIGPDEITNLKAFRRGDKYGRCSNSDIFSSIRVVDSFEECYESLSRATTWIFPGCEDARDGQRWAVDRGIDIPGDLSIISTQDSPELKKAGVSSCTPDWESAGYIMAHTIIGDTPVETSRKGHLRIKAIFRHRKTTL